MHPPKRNSPFDGGPRAKTAGWPRQRTWLVVALTGLLVAGAAAFVYRAYFDAGVFYLSQDPEVGPWIRNDEPFLLGIYRRRDWETLFVTHVKPREGEAEPHLAIRAFRRFEVRLEGKTIFRSPESWDAWKQTYDVPLGAGLRPRIYQLQVVVFNRDAHPCLAAACPQLGISTGADWLAARAGGALRPALLASQVVPPEVVQFYPTVAESFERIAPFLLVVLIAAAAGLWWANGAVASSGRLTAWLTPSTVRFCLLVAWVVLGANNIARVKPEMGYDQSGHGDYVKYVAERGALPLATDGWQMFQAPLFYLVAAPLFAALSQVWSEQAALLALRVLPLLCGLTQIELVYRVARVVFPWQTGAQIVATLVGGFAPANVYISQVVGNEPLAGSLTSLVVLLCVLLIAQPDRRRGGWYFGGLGVAWGLAILAKVTPIVLAPLVAAAIVAHTRARLDGWRTGAGRLAVAIAAAGAVAGWYFARNLYHLGVPFTSGWGEASGNAWWQDPGYRTWEQMSAFGTALSRPVYSGCWSFWDALYSTMWLDGFTSGRAELPGDLPWNVDWMMAGAWLGVLPTALIVGGFIATGSALWRGVDRGLWFAAAVVIVYLAALADRFLALPAFCAVKSTYMLGALPCLGVLAGAGAAPLMRHRIVRVLFGAALVCWAAATMAAYFSLSLFVK